MRRKARRKARPAGVTMVGVLYMLLAAVTLLTAMGAMQWAGMTVSELSVRLPTGPIWLVAGAALILTVLGLFAFLAAVVYALIAAGCFRGWGWVWTWAFIFALLSILLSVYNAYTNGLSSETVMATAISSIPPVLMLGYISTRKVRRFFGKT